MMSASTGTSSFGQQTGAPGRAGHRRDRADVVEVGVGEQDRLDGRAELLDRGEDAVGLVARVDDDRAVAAVGRAMKQFSWTGPTVRPRTSIRPASAARLLLLAAACRSQLVGVVASGM